MLPPNPNPPKRLAKPEWKPQNLSRLSFGNDNWMEIEQQPPGNYSYIPYKKGLFSQFQSTSQYGSMGILGHNFLSGAEFFKLQQGQRIRGEYQNGGGDNFEVQEIRRYQAVNPTSITSDFIDLETGKKYNYEDVYHDIYSEENQLVFQTCIEKNGDVNWGRYFVIARRLDVKGR